MAKFILYIGYFVWTGIFFFAMKGGLTTKKKEGVIRFMTKARALSPVGLGLPGGILFLLGFYFVYLQGVDIDNHVGLIGPKYQLGLLFGIIGSVALSAQLFLDRD